MPKSRESAAKEALQKEAGEAKEVKEAGEVREAPETTYSIDVGFEVESMRSDGSSVHETAVATSDTDGYTIVLAREGADKTRFRVVDAKEQAAEFKAGEQLDLFLDVAKKTIEPAIKAAGLKGAEADKARASIEAGLPAMVARALGEKSPDKSLTKSIQDAAAEKEVVQTPNLEELTLTLAHARQKVDSAKSDKEYTAAITVVHAAEKAVYEARVKLHPEAAPEEKATIADEADGSVELLPDPIYEKGHLDVLGSIQELEGSMREADAKKDAVAWTVARNERDRHMAILPIVEKVDALEKAQNEVDVAIAKLEEAKRMKVGMKKESLKRHHLNLQEVIQKKEELIKVLENQMRELDKKPKKGAEEKFAELEKGRREARAVIEGAQKILRKFINETEAFEKAGIKLDFDPNEKPDAARTALYHQLEDLFSENPRTVMDYITGALRSKETSESTRDILLVFLENVRDGVIRSKEAEEASVIPSPVEGSEVEEIPPIIYSEYKVPDLIAAGIVEKADDLAALEKTFVELTIAMESLGLEPKDEGLPSSFKEMLETKDSRGFFGKLFNKKTDRAKLFNKLSRAYYTYVASGKVDVKKVLASQKTRYEDFADQMRRAGKL